MINGITAPEYDLPDASTTAASDGYIDTYIAVKPSDRISLKWIWTGSLLHGQLDWIADGTLVRENRIEGDSQKGAVKYVKKSLRFDTGLDCPKPPNWTSVEPNKDLYEGNLVVTNLDKESLDEKAGGSRPGVGSLVFVMSVNQFSADNYHDPEKSIEMYSWKKRAGDEVRQAQIPPEYALELQWISNDKITSKRSIQHRNRFGQIRFGLKAWGKMCFYYRSATSIEEAGGAVRDENTILEVEAWDGLRPFVAVDQKKRAAPRKKGGPASDDEDGDESLFVSMGGTPERTINLENASDHAATPKPKKKKAKLGGALFGSEEKASHKEDDAIMEANEEQMEVNEEQAVDDEGFDSQDDVEPTSAELAAAPDEGPSLPGSNDSTKKLDYIDQASDDDASAAGLFDDRALPPPNWKFPSSPPILRPRKTTENVPSSPPANSAVDPSFDSPMESPTSPTPLTAAPAANNITAQEMAKVDSTDKQTDPERGPDMIYIPTIVEIGNEIHPTGTPRAQIQQLFLDGGPFDDPDGMQVIFNQRIDTVAVLKSDGKYYLKPEEGGGIISQDPTRPAILPRPNGKLQKDSPVPRAATKKDSPAPAPKAAIKKTSAPAKQTAAGRTKSNTKPVAPSALAGGEHSRAPPRQAPPSAGVTKRKRSPPPVPTTTPAQANRRFRTASATPSSGGTSRKKKLAMLRSTLAAKQARIEQAAENAKQKDDEIAELERLNDEADQKLIELEDDEDSDDDMEDDDGTEGGEEDDME